MYTNEHNKQKVENFGNYAVKWVHRTQWRPRSDGLRKWDSRNSKVKLRKHTRIGDVQRNTAFRIQFNGLYHFDNNVHLQHPIWPVSLTLQSIINASLRVRMAPADALWLMVA